MKQQSKPFYLSKVYWTNILMAGVCLLPEQYRGFALSADVQALAFTGVNLVLRAVTKDNLTLS